MAASDKPNTAMPAPRADMNRTSDWWEHVADISATDIDLRQRQHGGNHAAQRVRLKNNTAGPLVAVLLQELPSGLSVTSMEQSITVGANSEYTVDRAIRKIISSGSGALQADCFWWFASNTFPNP
jgi:hypothetical protein